MKFVVFRAFRKSKTAREKAFTKASPPHIVVIVIPHLMIVAVATAVVDARHRTGRMARGAHGGGGNSQHGEIQKKTIT